MRRGPRKAIGGGRAGRQVCGAGDCCAGREGEVTRGCAGRRGIRNGKEAGGAIAALVHLSREEQGVGWNGDCLGIGALESGGGCGEASGGAMRWCTGQQGRGLELQGMRTLSRTLLLPQGRRR